MLTSEQKLRLKKAVRKPADYTQENPELDAVIKEIKKESPHLFHTSDTLKTRVFITPPLRPIPHAGLR